MALVETKQNDEKKGLLDKIDQSRSSLVNEVESKINESMKKIILFSIIFYFSHCKI